MHGRGPRDLAGPAYIYSDAKPRGPEFARAWDTDSTVTCC